MGKDDPEKSEAPVRAMLRLQAKRAIALRSKDREFHGLQREFFNHQAKMWAEYEESRDVKHPRDVGGVREQILRKFLLEGGFVPKRYGTSDRSIRVVSTSGHTSKEIDIALYDAMDSVSLMHRADVYEVLPVESVFGVIQVKSRLGKKELRDGLANLRSFKRLARSAGEAAAKRISRSSGRGFALLFAFESPLPWSDLVAEIKSFAEKHPHQEWTNAIFILDRGFFLHGDDTKVSAFNADIEGLHALRIHGFPDRQGHCLFQFQSVLLDLLRDTPVQQVNVGSYFQLPLVAEEQSYSFSLGEFAEIGCCAEHGDFSRTIDSKNLLRLVNWCDQTEPVAVGRAIELAYGISEDEAARQREPGLAYIYNPENRGLREILTQDGGPIAFDMIQTAGKVIYLPFYYSVKEGIISGCPKCSRDRKRHR